MMTVIHRVPWAARGSRNEETAGKARGTPEGGPVAMRGQGSKESSWQYQMLQVARQPQMAMGVYQGSVFIVLMHRSQYTRQCLAHSEGNTSGGTNIW